MSCALNEPAADMTLVDLETGERKQLMDLIAANEGKHTILTFYATWSKACEQEVELMELFSKGDHHKLLNFVLVNLDQNVGATLAFLDTIVEIKGVKKPRVRRFYGDGENPTVMHFGLADAEVPGPYGLQSVPHTVVINPDGIVLRNGDNFHWDDIAGLLRHRQEMTDPGVLNQLIRWLIPPLTV